MLEGQKGDSTSHEIAAVSNWFPNKTLDHENQTTTFVQVRLSLSLSPRPCRACVFSVLHISQSWTHRPSQATFIILRQTLPGILGGYQCELAYHFQDFQRRPFKPYGFPRAPRCHS